MQSGGVVDQALAGLAVTSQSGHKFDELYQKVLHETEEALSYNRNEAESRLFSAAHQSENSSKKMSTNGIRPAADGEQKSDHSQPQPLPRHSEPSSMADPRKPPIPTPRQPSMDNMGTFSRSLEKSNNHSKGGAGEEYSENFEKTQSDISEDISEEFAGDSMDVPNNSPSKGIESDDSF